MRAKLALALALAPRPAVLILDEPTAGLDPLAAASSCSSSSRRPGSIGARPFSLRISSMKSSVARIAWASSTRAACATKARSKACALPCAACASPTARTSLRRPGLSAGRMRPSTARMCGFSRAAEEHWQALALPPGASVEALSLEDAFIACVGSRVVAL
ncbi:MAG: hypothetical protein WDN28_31420 [Chthoniobacter sp.]